MIIHWNTPTDKNSSQLFMTEDYVWNGATTIIVIPFVDFSYQHHKLKNQQPTGGSFEYEKIK
jgi:hypothetical protein